MIILLYTHNSMCKQDKCTNLNIYPQELIPASEFTLIYIIHNYLNNNIELCK